MIKGNLRILGRSLLIGLLTCLILIGIGRVRAIASGVNLIPFLSPPVLSPPDPVLPSEEEITVFSLMPGGRLFLQAASEVAKRSAPGGFVPRQEQVVVDRSNYDPRMAVDLYGRPLSNAPIVVLHETVGSATSAINTFLTPHPNDDDQASYHSLIKRDGTIVYLVPPEMRAFGAGDSVFNGPNGPETVKINPNLPPSVNNFAYHSSLESPPDGRGEGYSHSGYTSAQYQSLAWLVAQTRVPDNRITTHRIVDRSGTRRDPRSFDFQQFLNLVHRYQQQMGIEVS
jgi:hypothetical protein